MFSLLKNASFRWALPIISGLLLALSLDVPMLWPLAFVGLLPLLLFIQTSHSYRDVFGGGWLAGTILIGGALIWFWDTLPLEWLGVESQFVAVLYLILGWGIILTLPLALSVGAWAVLTRVVITRSYVPIILVPILWAFFEYLRTWIYFVVTYGDGSSFGPHFTIGFVGYVLANHPLLLQFAGFGKIYLLSFLVALINFILWRIFITASLRTAHKIVYSIVLPMILVGASLIQVHTQANASDRTISLAVLHTNFPSALFVTAEAQAQKQTELLRLVREAVGSEEQPDVVVLPEDARFLPPFTETDKFVDFISPILGNKEVLLVDSGRTTDRAGVTTQRLLYYENQRNNLEMREKIFLLPQGEYVPELFSLALGFFGHSTEELKKYRTYRPGDTYTVGGESVRVGGLFCSELFSPSIYSRVAAQEPDMLVNVSSQSWFHGSRILHYQTQMAAKVRAVETGLPLAVASNMSPAFLINREGAIVAESGWEKNEVLKHKIGIPSKLDE